jgi:hypothetical protein
VVPARDVRALADAIVAALADHDERARRADAARAHVERHHALGPWLERVTGVVDGLVGVAAARPT